MRGQGLGAGLGAGRGGGGGILARLTLSDMRVEMERPISW